MIRIQISAGAFIPFSTFYKGKILNSSMKKILTHKRNVKQRLKDIDKWKITTKEKKEVKDFVNAYVNGDVTGRVGTNQDAITERTLQYLRPCLEFLKGKRDIGQIKKLKDSLLKDKIGHYNRITNKFNGNSYATRSKKIILSTLAQFLKYTLEPKKYVEISSPLLIKFASKKPEPEFLEVKEIEKLYKACSTNAQRFLIANLFASGQRAEEFHNNRFSDYTLPTGKENFVKLRVRNNFSKTEGRTISLYFTKSLEATRDYIEERKQEGIEPEDVLFKPSYDTMRKWLTRLGQRVLNKNVHYHLFRSSCATWLAHKMNRQQMCIFFGWKFNSPMPDVYISRQGLEMKEVDSKLKATEVENLKNKIETQESQIKELSQQYKDFHNAVKDMALGMKFSQQVGDKLNKKGKVQVKLSEDVIKWLKEKDMQI